MDIGRHSAFGQYHRHLHWLTLALLLMAGTAEAQDAGMFRTDSYLSITRTSKMTWSLRYDRLVDSLRNVSLFVDIPLLSDTIDLSVTRGPTIKRDTASLAALADKMYPRSAGGSMNDYATIRFYGVLGSVASDSINLTVGVNGIYEAVLPNYAVYAFNFAIIATTPGDLISSFRTDLPALSVDSMFIVRVSRNATLPALSRCAVTIYKIARGTGPDVNDKTAGVFYDRTVFNEAVLSAGTNRFFTLDLGLKRKL